MRETSATDELCFSKEPKSWLIRIPEIFEGVANQLLDRFGVEGTTRLGADYYLIKTSKPECIRNSEEAKFVQWNLPMEHTWPCNAQKMDGFIEKAAQTLLRKFGEREPQGIFVGQLNPGSPSPYYKGLASNLRGRTLQLFPNLKAATVEAQNPSAETLFCLIGKEGLFCGMQSPKDSNGLYPGGSKFIGIDSPNTIRRILTPQDQQGLGRHISRAGAKIAEALHYLIMHRPALPAGSHWVELGASPGGMTSELLARNQRVTAIDRAPLDDRLRSQAGLTFVLDDVARFTPANGAAFDAILSDMNGPPEDSIAQVIRLSRYLKKKGLVVFTLKVPHVETVEEPCRLFRDIVQKATASDLVLLASTHLTYNRHEFTLFFERR